MSVVILTLNEQINIAECIESCAWSDDVHVLDSGSTDDTCAIAGRLGAKVYQRAFTSFGDQRFQPVEALAPQHRAPFVPDKTTPVSGRLRVRPEISPAVSGH